MTPRNLSIERLNELTRHTSADASTRPSQHGSYESRSDGDD